MLKLSACANTWNINYSSHTHFWSKPIRQYQTSFPSQYETSKTRLGGSSWMKQESMVQHGAADPAFSTRHSLHWGENLPWNAGSFVSYHSLAIVGIIILLYHGYCCFVSFYCYAKHDDFLHNNSWLVVFRPTPLKNDGLKVSWDDEIPNIEK